MSLPPVPPIFASRIIDKKSDLVPIEVLLGTSPILGLYFSANWCPPCKVFTPRLIEFYKTHNEFGKKIEIIFISGDENYEKFKEYYGSMPWLSVDFDDPGREDLIEHYNIQGIPALLIIDKEGKVKSREGRQEILSKGLDALKGW